MWRPVGTARDVGDLCVGVWRKGWPSVGAWFRGRTVLPACAVVWGLARVRRFWALFRVLERVLGWWEGWVVCVGSGYPQEVMGSEKMKLGQVGTSARGRGAGPDGRAGPRDLAGGGRGPRARARRRALPAAMLAGVGVKSSWKWLRLPSGSSRSRLSALLAAAAAHPGRPGRSAGEPGARGLGGRSGPEGADPAPPQSAPENSPPTTSQSMHPQSSRASTSGGPSLYPTGPAHGAGARPPPRLGPHSSAGTPPPTTAFLRELFLRYPRSPGLPAPGPQLRWSPSQASSTFPGPTLAPPPPGPAPCPRPGAGRPAWAAAGPSLSVDSACPPYPTAQRGRGRGGARLQLPFCSAWDGETLPGGPAGLV